MKHFDDRLFWVWLLLNAHTDTLVSVNPQAPEEQRYDVLVGLLTVQAQGLKMGGGGGGVHGVHSLYVYHEPYSLYVYHKPLPPPPPPFQAPVIQVSIHRRQ
jgi:hypothetical protein